MGLPEPIARPLRTLAATRVGATVYRVAMPPLDRAVKALTGGRHTFVGLVLPTLMLTSTGRRSGEPRTQPLVYIDTADGYLVVGTNWGQEHHPAWTHNLLATPEATVDIGGRRIPVTARLLAGPERAQAYARFEALSPNYREYPQWAGDREIRVFLLEPR